MNNLDKQYQALLQNILDNGTIKGDRTGTGTKSIFGVQIRHNMQEGFPLLTTKKMAWKQIVTELIWFLRGDTNIKYLIDNNCHIWDGDAYKNYVNCCNLKPEEVWNTPVKGSIMSKEEFINKIKTDEEFAKKWGELGPIYGKQWRSWERSVAKVLYPELQPVDQIKNLINDLNTNPDSRRLMVSAWNVSEIDHMVLPPCHYGFQVYTRELSFEERWELSKKYGHTALGVDLPSPDSTYLEVNERKEIESLWSDPTMGINLPSKAISLMWNQRSVDTFLGLPFNIASYGLLLEILGKMVNMMPDQLIGSLGDTHLYLNHLEQAKEQIGRDMTNEERMSWWFDNNKPNRDVVDYIDDTLTFEDKIKYLDRNLVPKKTREPFALPKLNISEHVIDITAKFRGDFVNSKFPDLGPDFGYFKDVYGVIESLTPSDFTLEDYQSHPKIEAPLSN